MNNSKFTFLLNLCFLFTLFYSCKKDDKLPNNIIPPPASSGISKCLPDSAKNENDSSITTYFFDSQKRILKIGYYTIGFYYTEINFDYNSFEAILTSDNPTHKYGLNAQGYPKYYAVPWSNTNFVDTTFYVYNSENYIIQENDTFYWQGAVNGYNITTHQITNGNRVYSLKKGYSSSGTEETSDTSYYEYYLDKENTIDFEFGLKGKKNTNLLKHKYETFNGGHDWMTNDFNYELDNKGYITKKGERKILFQSNMIWSNDTSNVIINYQCN